MGMEKKERLRLTVIFRPSFQSANFVIGGIKLPEVRRIPLEFRRGRLSYALYGLFLKLHLFRLAFRFRYAKETRNALESVSDDVLFWDCCQAEKYRMLDSVLDGNVFKSVFFWNPLSRWCTDKERIRRKMAYFKKRNFRFFTFDPRDADWFGMSLLKNVNRMLPADLPVQIKQDFYFVGKVKNRGDMLRSLESCLREKGFLTRFQLVEKKSDAISNEENIQHLRESACIVDIVSEEQSGLTLRPFDALFLGRKLLTNCAAVANMDFYDPANIYIVRDLRLEGIEDFMRTPYKKVDERIILQYEINQWIRNNF